MMDGLAEDGLACSSRVVIAYRYVPQYRYQFYNELRKELANRHIALQLIYGQPIEETASGWNSVDLGWGTKIDNRVLAVRGKTVCYQPIIKATASADLIIVEQANRLLVNYVLLARQRVGGPPVAFWGHGRNFQASASPVSRLSEAFKRWLARAPAWWFAYTEGVRAILTSLGYPPGKITVVQNSTDISDLKLDQPPSSSIVEDLYGRPLPDKLCLSIGELGSYKGLDLLLAAGERIASALPGFGLGIIGDGPLRQQLEEAARSTHWLQVLGPRFGRDLATITSAARLLLIPKGIGLVAVDSFAMGVPIVTIAGRRQMPEFEYLKNDINSVVLDENSTAKEYADSVISLLSDVPRLEQLRAGARASAKEFSVERMACLFADGIEAALSQ
jgi:glycosyltransferase involved in cell wall biosynthesis